MGEKILDLLRQGWSYNVIVAEIGCSKSTINYYAKKLGTAKKLRVYDWKVVQEYHDQGNNLSQCRNQFGFSKDAWDKAVERGELRPREWRIPLADLLVSDRGKKTSRKHLKVRLLLIGLLQDHCYECGLTEWRGRKLTMEMHHINGVSNDNRLENIVLLCPNCHSLTPNYCGKNKKRIAR